MADGCLWVYRKSITIYLQINILNNLLVLMPIFCCLISEAYFVGVRFLGAHGADCQIADAQSGDIYEPAI